LLPRSATRARPESQLCPFGAHSSARSKVRSCGPHHAVAAVCRLGVHLEGEARVLVAELVGRVKRTKDVCLASLRLRG
jgi:hypothetical protein